MAPDTSSSRPLPDLIAGRYRIQSRLGVGGMGVVYKALDIQLNRAVAIKALEERRVLLAGSPTRLRNEALAAAALDHPYVCKVYELVETPTDTFIVMEYVEGETLASILKRGPLPLPHVLLLGREIAEGLANAHARGLVHRDVKPSNVMVTPHGHVKLLDFGVAGADVASLPADATRTQTPHVTIQAGTPHYMAPEQAAGQPVTARADLFSLGVVLYECITGQLPFSGTTTFDYVRHVMQSAPRRLDRLAPETPADLVDLIERCLEKEPVSRPDSADAVVSELRRLSDALTSSGSAHALRTVGDVRAGRRWRVGAVTAAIVAAGATIWALLPPTAAPDRPLTQLRPFVTSAAQESGSRISPDGQWVAYLAAEGGSSRVMLQQIDGGDARPMTLERGTPESAVWSPDGRHLAVLMLNEQSRGLQVYPAFFGGASAETIAVPPEYTQVRLLRWIDDAIHAEAFDAKARLFRLIAIRPGDSDPVRSLSDNWPALETVRSMDIRPDGRAVALVRLLDGREDLWILHLADASLRQLTDDAFFERRPIWDGTGARIIFQSNRGGQLDLWEIDPVTRRAEVLTSGEMEKIPESTSADGRVISFQRLSQDARLWRWDPRSGDAQQLTQDALSDHSPSISNAGRIIAFQRSQPIPSRGYTLLDAKLHVAAFDEAGGIFDVRTLGDGYGACVSPDGAWIAYLQPVEKAAQVSVVLRNLTTGASQTLTTAAPLPAFSNQPVDFASTIAAWSASGDLWFIDSADAPMIRRFTPGMKEAATVARIGEAVFVRDLVVSADGRRAAWLLLRRANPGKAELQVMDATGDASPRSIATFDASFTAVALRGWLGGNLVTVRRIALHNDLTADLEVSLVDGAMGTARPAGILTGAFIATTRLDPARRVLYVTRADRGAHNLHEFAIGSGAVRALTRNALPGVTFSGFVPTGSGGVVGVREERRQDLWLIQPAPPAAGNSAGR